MLERRACVNESEQRPIVFQIVGYKNTGKTTLVCRLTSLLKEDGYIVGTIKHDAHEFRMDHPGTDTWKHQRSGADLTAISSSTGTAFVSRQPSTLKQLIELMAGADYVLVEGFKQEAYPKLLLIRNEGDLELAKSVSRLAAVALWPEASRNEAIRDAISSMRGIPCFLIDEPKAILTCMRVAGNERNAN